MKILHGTWIPHSGEEFIQEGSFCLWVEIDTPSKQRKSRSRDRHPQQLSKDDLSKFLLDELGLIPLKDSSIDREITTKYFILPSTNAQPLPSLELTRYLETESPEPTTWKSWAIDCYLIGSIVKTLNNIHFWCFYHSSEIQFGSDLLFWYHYSQSFQEVIRKDRYIPALKYRENSIPKSKGNKSTAIHEIYPGWEIISEAYETKIRQYVDYLPVVCTGGSDESVAALEFYDPETLLRHFSECLLQQSITSTPIPAAFTKKIFNSSLLTGCLEPPVSKNAPWTFAQAIEIYKQW